MAESAAPKAGDDVAAAKLASCGIGYRRSKTEPIAGRQESENNRDGHRYKYACAKKRYEVTP